MPQMATKVLLAEDNTTELGTFKPRALELGIGVFVNEEAVPDLDQTLVFSSKTLPDGRNKTTIKYTAPDATSSLVPEYADNTAFIQVWTSSQTDSAARGKLRDNIIAALRLADFTSMVQDREGMF